MKTEAPKRRGGSKTASPKGRIATGPVPVSGTENHLRSMKYVEFSVAAAGTWYAEIMRTHPEVRLISDHVSLLPHGQIVSRLEILATSDEEVDLVLAAIQNLRRTRNWILAREKNRARVLVVGPQQYGLTANVLKAGGVLVHPVVAHDQRQYFSVLSPAKTIDDFQSGHKLPGFKLHLVHRDPSALKELPEMRDLIDDLNEELTEKQLEILFASYRANYFAWPHHSTIADLAKRAGISQATFHEHLQKATARVMARVLSRLGRRRGQRGGAEAS